MNIFTYVIDKNIYINLTNRCSNNCDFCIRNTNDGISGYHLWLDTDPTAEQVIAELDKMTLGDYEQVVFCGFGEPIYAYEVIKQVANYAHEKGLTTRINTNGQAKLILGRDITSEIGSYIDIINVSLNATDATKYDDICHSEFGTAAYDELLTFAKGCKASAKQVILSIVDSIGAEEIAKSKVIAESIGVTLRVRELID